MQLPFDLKPEDILEAEFFSEPVRVLKVYALGANIKIEAVGITNRQFYSRILTPEDVAKIKITTKPVRGFTGNAEAFFLAMEAHRIRFAYQFDPLLAVNVSQVDPLPHQIEAVYHYILRNPRIRFLLADDPGAGKTIMSGLLIKELKYRGLVRRTLIVVPGHLKDQWLREMKERFEESFTVIDRSMMNANWGRNIWQEFPQVITSMDFGKQDDVMASLAESQWDLIIVDEAHKMAAYRYGDKTSKTERYRFGELLSRIGQYLLFLTATPHRGDPGNFRLFLELLEPGMFSNEELLMESIQNRDNPLFLRRLKEDLKDFYNRPLFPPRYVFTRTYRLSDEEKRLYNAVTKYVEESYNKALAKEKRNVAFALLILQRRMASSVRAVRRSLERRKERLEELRMYGDWLAKEGSIDEDALEDFPEAERLKQEEELVERLTAAETQDELDAEIKILEELVRLAREAERQEVETKLNELRQVMEDEKVRERQEKILIFTESSDTLQYLAEKIKSWGYSVVTLHGGLGLDARIKSEHQFRENAQVMVSTEAGGEGINLQFCSLMVNYDIPWNPNRLEQRMGRIHRYGQQKEVHIYNLVAYDTREGSVLRALFDKLEQIQKSLGSDRVFDVIGELVQKRTLKDLIVDAISNRRTLDEIIGEIQAVQDKEAINKIQEASLVALATKHIDIQKVLGEDRRARESRLVPEYIELFFERACKFLNVNIERRRDGLLRIPSVPYELRNVTQDFKNRYGAVFSDYNKIAFDKKIAREQNAVFVAPGHPLLETIVESIISKCKRDIESGAVFADPDGRLDGWLWFLLGEIRDGNNQIAGRRIFTVYKPIKNGEPRLINSSILWDLKPITDYSINEQPPTEDEVISFVIDNALKSYRDEILKERERQANIRERYGLRSLEQLILESDAKILEYEERRTRGEEIPDMEITNEQRRKEEYIARKKSLEEDISRQKNLLLTTPEPLGVVRVIPQIDVDPSLRSDAEIEAIGMRAVMEYEQQQGRSPEDVSAQNLGYDIRSYSADKTVRYIEVKARATTGEVVLTPNEWLMAQRLGADYWLYVVENAATKPIINPIPNPAKSLNPQEVVKTVRYIVKDWKEKVANERK